MVVVEIVDLVPCWGFVPTVNGFQLIVACLVVCVPFLIPRFPVFSGFDFEGEKGGSDLFPESPF